MDDQKQKQLIKKLSIAAVIIIPLFLIISGLIGTNNKSNRYKNMFTSRINDRTSMYDKMWKTLSQKGQVAIKNDSSFYRNIEAIMQARSDSGLLMKWVQESNPNQNYNAVSDLYADLSRAIEANRDEFFRQEKTLSDIKRQHDNLLGEFPSSMWASVLGIKAIEYKPITSDRTDEVIRTSKDNDVKVF